MKLALHPLAFLGYGASIVAGLALPSSTVSRRCNDTTLPTPTPTPPTTTDLPGPVTDEPAPPTATPIPPAGGFPSNKVWSGSNLFYAAGLDADQRNTLLSGLQDAGMSVLRVWLDGQGGNRKGTPFPAYPGLEPDQIGSYNDEVLERLDDFMIDAKEYGVKLMISIHSFNALSGGNDPYGKQFGDGNFYETQEATDAFDNRIRHVLNHEHKTLGKKWAELPEYIFAFEDQNEAMISKGEGYIKEHQAWHCGRAKAMKDVLGANSTILTTTGGAQWASESWLPELLDCPELNMIALHAYAEGEFTVDNLGKYVDMAAAKGKMVYMQEWGVCYHNGSNNCTPSNGVADQGQRNKNIEEWANNISASKMPWMYWQVLPNDDPHEDWDYEIGIGFSGWEELKRAGINARTFDSPIDYAPYLL